MPQPQTPNTQLLTGIGNSAIGYAWKAVQQAFILRDIDAQITNMELLASTTGDPTITDEFTKWKQNLNNQIKQKQTHLTHNKAEAYLIYNKQIQPYIEEETKKIYRQLIAQLRQKGLIEFTTTTAKPRFTNMPEG